MKKMSIVIAAAAALMIGAATSVIAFAKSEPEQAAATNTQVEESTAANPLDGKIIVMRSFFGGYVIDEDDIPKIKAASQREDIETKDLKEMVRVIENGQEYEDSELGCTYVICRKKGNENTTFELPRQNPKFYDLSDYDFATETNYYKLDKTFTNVQVVEGQYGDFSFISK